LITQKQSIISNKEKNCTVLLSHYYGMYVSL